jgi:cobalt-zinc-cadmium resistance protein CzcA
VFCNVPFATIGGVVALWASGEFLSVPASVGFIALMGIAVLNGVVLISYINEVVARGDLPLAQAVMEGARRRLRPVMLTASIAALGLVPFLFATGPGAEIQRPLAIVVIGGLVTATALTLLLLPVMYERFGVSRDSRDLGSNLSAGGSHQDPLLVPAGVQTREAARAPDREKLEAEPFA